MKKDLKIYKKLLKELEDIYFGTIAVQNLKEKDQFVDFEDLKKRLLQQKEPKN